MAITLITTPLDIVPAYNPIIITAESDMLAEINFRYVIDVIITYPVNATKTVKMSPRPDGFLLFDAHRIIENYLSYDFNIGEETDSYSCPNSYVVYQLYIYEEYGDPIATYAGESVNGYAINSAVKHSVASFGTEPALINLDLKGDYMMADNVFNADKPFLTSSPRTLKICSDENYYLYAVLNLSNEPPDLMLSVYDEAGGLLGTEIKNLTGTDIILRYGVGTKNINEWNPAYLVGASYYTVQLYGTYLGTPTPISELFTFNIDCDCSKYNEKFRLHWLNPLGGFDAFTFNQRFDRTLNIKKSNYTKILGAVDSVGAFTFETSQAGKVNFNTISNELAKINSEWITEEECNWLFTAVKSSQVFWEINSTTYAPVVVINNTYQQKTYAGEKLFNLELTIEISNVIISQRQ